MIKKIKQISLIVITVMLLLIIYNYYTGVKKYSIKVEANNSYLESSQEYIEGDLNKNGKIDLQDIILLLRKYLGLDTTSNEFVISDKFGDSAIASFLENDSSDILSIKEERILDEACLGCYEPVYIKRFTLIPKKAGTESVVIIQKNEDGSIDHMIKYDFIIDDDLNITLSEKSGNYVIDVFLPFSKTADYSISDSSLANVTMNNLTYDGSDEVGGYTSEFVISGKNNESFDITISIYYDNKVESTKKYSFYVLDDVVYLWSINDEISN